LYILLLFPCSVPELSFIEPQGLTSDHVKELTEEVEKLAKESVGEVGRRERAWQLGQGGGERECVCTCIRQKEREDVCVLERDREKKREKRERE
jgi:hypothetical protein